MLRLFTMRQGDSLITSGGVPLLLPTKLSQGLKPREDSPVAMEYQPFETILGEWAEPVRCVTGLSSIVPPVYLPVIVKGTNGVSGRGRQFQVSQPQALV